ncbi:MAG TPA: elongation factor 4, partial [Acidimicrobiaceae bacterium]|nr:elongation factor 4 [Acidimicrobiaceae bacterium]
RERLEREFDLSLIATAPSVAYVAVLLDGETVRFDNPSEMPDPSRLDHIDEPMLRATLIVPAEYIGTVMDLCQSRRGELERMEYLSPERMELVYRIPLAEVVVDFFDQLK